MAAYAGLYSTAAVAAPIIIELENGTITEYFDSDNAKMGRARNVPELTKRVQEDERTPFERLWAWIKRVYLPAGYPSSVTRDYLAFTKYRTLQNLASSIMTVISTEALLFGLGLGKKVAAGIAATNWVLKDGASYLAKVFYGSVAGSKFDMDPKAWRVAADITEDVGGMMEILTPLFPSNFLLLASAANILKGVSQMTGTATRHVVYRSLAASGQQNIGDIATKGESQGVTLKMLGLGAGIMISSRIGQNYYRLLGAYWAFAAVHLAANWRSMRCVQFSYFNKQRAAIAIEHHLQGKPLPTPYEVSHIERIILPPWRGFEPYVRIGASVRNAVSRAEQLQVALQKCPRERFVITVSPGGYINTMLRDDATPIDPLRAYYAIQVLLRNRRVKSAGILPDIQIGEEIREACAYMRKNVHKFLLEAASVGWDVRHIVISDSSVRVRW